MRRIAELQHLWDDVAKDFEKYKPTTITPSLLLPTYYYELILRAR